MSHSHGHAVMAKAGWEWQRCAGKAQAEQRCHIPVWPGAGSKVLGAAGNVAGLNPVGSAGWWGALDPQAQRGVLLPAESPRRQCGVCCLEKALPSQRFLR